MLGRELGMVTIAVSGGFDPLHEGHLEHLIEASKLGDKLLVFVSNDYDMVCKKGKCNLPLWLRITTVELWLKHYGINGLVIEALDKDGTQRKTLSHFKPDIYAKGGDRTPDNMLQCEIDVCEREGIQIVYGIGRQLNQSSRMVI